MSRIIVIANQKGGVGKTTTAVNIGAYLAEAGKKVLLVDFDPQGNLSSSFGLQSMVLEQEGLDTDGIYEAITEKRKLKDIVRTTDIKGLFVATSNLSLSGANIELANVENREYFLRNCLEGVANDYDFIFVDCPPSLGVLTINGFVAADEVLIPLQCEFFALEGLLVMLINTIQRIQQNLNKNLRIGGIAFTMYDSRTRLANEVINKVRASLGKNSDLLFDTIIPRNVKLAEAPSHGLPISLYGPGTTGGESYKRLAKEVLKRG